MTVIESQICHVTGMGLLRKRKLERLKRKSEGTANEGTNLRGANARPTDELSLARGGGGGPRV